MTLTLQNKLVLNLTPKPVEQVTAGLVEKLTASLELKELRVSSILHRPSG
jgi:hypothetical protein